MNEVDATAGEHPVAVNSLLTGNQVINRHARRGLAIDIVLGKFLVDGRTAILPQADALTRGSGLEPFLHFGG